MSTVLHVHNDIETRDGYAWPKADDVAFDHVKMYLPLLRLAAKQAQHRRVAVQAGGNAGMHPVELAKIYDKVVTFEPEKLNYECLRQNVEDHWNVTVYNAAIGNNTNPVKVRTVPGLDREERLCVNTGAFRVEEGGDIPQMRIDDLGLDHLDFLQLDVEGFELNAILGGIETIKRHWPVIMVERFNQGDDPEPLLLDLGYSRIIKGAYDCVYVKHNGTDNVC